MIEVYGDLWTYTHEKPIIRCITTNGMVKRDGTCVMGRGCAREAAKKYPELPKLLGVSIRNNGNILRVFPNLGARMWAVAGADDNKNIGDHIIAFPVKHKWMEPADPLLIVASAETLARVARKDPDTIFLLPRPGCGNGQLDWKDVKPLLEFMPDNVLVITNQKDSHQAEPPQ